MPTRVQVIHDTSKNDSKKDWVLAFQWCQYIHEGRPGEFGYRFIWRYPKGKLQPARGQARLPSIRQIRKLIKQAEDEGWGDLRGEN
jgi:hypothetical protein